VRFIFRRTREWDADFEHVRDGHVSHIIARTAPTGSYETACGLRIPKREAIPDTTGRKPVCKSCERR
jgi:hypothetical protein